jgi:hypothetical protein
MQGEGQHITYNFAMQWLHVRLVVWTYSLKKLDLPQTNLDFGQKKIYSCIYGVWCFSYVWWFVD